MKVKELMHVLSKANPEGPVYVGHIPDSAAGYSLVYTAYQLTTLDDEEERIKGVYLRLW